jgi:hypothetical protein
LIFLAAALQALRSLQLIIIRIIIKGIAIILYCIDQRRIHQAGKKSEQETSIQAPEQCRSRSCNMSLLSPSLMLTGT